MRASVVLMLVGMWANVAWGQPRAENIFFVGPKERPTRVVVTTGDELAPGEPRSEMMGMLEGIVAELSGPEVTALLATPMPRAKLVDARGNLDRIGVAHLIGKGGVKRVELLAGNEGMFLAKELDAPEGEESGRVSKLDPERFRGLTLNWPRYRGVFEKGKESAQAGTTFELEKPYVQAPLYFDKDTLEARFTRGGKSALGPVTRLLTEETMYARLPRGYDPKKPVGVLVWVNAAQDGRPPEVFEGALDELGLIGVGVQDIGNSREPADRFQLAMDAAWTVCARYHVDSRRVYITGLSGGGRITSRLLICVSDYFTGAVPIVGMDAYFNTPVGNGQHVAGMFRRPEGKVWAFTKKRRMAMITGDGDPNGVSIREGAKLMAGDGLKVRVFDYKRYGHHMPSASQFREAIAWVDEPYQRERAAEEAAARAALAKYTDKHGMQPPANEKQRAELMRVTEAGPWTVAAWEAVELLRSGGKSSERE